MEEQEKAIVPAEQLTYAFYAKARNGAKRDYVYDFSVARKCPHPNLVATSLGGNTYRCTECNYFYTIVTAYVEPMHLATVKAAYQLLHFAKEFGVHALQEVLRQPHGQSDGTPHKGVIPDGMTLSDAVMALESINVNTPDRGAAELRRLVEAVWPNDTEVKRRIKALRGSDAPGKQEYAESLEGLLKERQNAIAGRDAEGQSLRGSTGSDNVPSLPEATE